MVGVERFELPALWSQTRCATRLRYTPTARFYTHLRRKFNPKSSGICKKYTDQAQLWLSRARINTSGRISKLPVFRPCNFT